MTLPTLGESFTIIVQTDRPHTVDCIARFRSAPAEPRTTEAAAEPFARAGRGPVTGAHCIPNGAVPR